ncbi:murein L,D-transpeptidase catalytic domain family protein [Flavobacterium tyrosinilyticum]|uniref:murein L,D-transpeptidase catalytic domain family protein n=1 Tax=Flavobacterium tyrosinilyticum TaxID=1658740 RepID=UPI00202E0AF4|nr:murein L,D-transpeptidase catalytic domain family protein [Flavobacterium tyrosinilyticum]MCM0664680.1 murein L,D-transpeptidase catalytic domain family protein [Flavobacterium tyrosinilyticum]
MIYKIYPLFVFLLLSFGKDSKSTPDLKKNATVKAIAKVEKLTVDSKIESVYNSLNSNNFKMPELKTFSEALKGFYLLKEKGVIKKNILTLIDFSLSSNSKRLWVIDLTSNTILFNSLVAHGRNTGEEFASAFSNLNSSFKSSLGFYATGEIYQGKHGASLRLDGLENGVNDNARERGVVMHGADYVSESFIRDHKRLGRSQGCPAVPVELTNEIIQLIKDKSCLYIYHPSRSFSMEERLIS